VFALDLTAGERPGFSCRYSSWMSPRRRFPRAQLSAFALDSTTDAHPGLQLPVFALDLTAGERPGFSCRRSSWMSLCRLCSRAPLPAITLDHPGHDSEPLQDTRPEHRYNKLTPNSIGSLCRQPTLLHLQSSIVVGCRLSSWIAAAGVRPGRPPGSSAPRAARLGVRTSAWLDRSTFSSARSPNVHLARALHVQLSSESGRPPGSSAPRAAQRIVRTSTWLERHCR